MTDTNLPEFEGIPVYSAAMAIRGLGDGLSKAVATDPRAFHQRDRVFIVVEAECTDVRHPVLKDTDGLTRKHEFLAGTATFVDESLVRDLLDAQDAKNEALAGVKRLPFDEDAAAELAEADAAEQAGEPEPA